MKQFIHFYAVFFLLFSFCQINAQSSMQWIVIEDGVTNSACSSVTDCDTDVLCFGLEYTPGETGTLTSYTTGFFLNCVGASVPYNESCVMTDNSNYFDFCTDFNFGFINSSGNDGTISVTTDVPVIIHQVCFEIPAGQSLVITEDVDTDLTAAITAATNHIDYPSYAEFTVVRDDICLALLPVELISFDAQIEGQTNLLNWGTASEKNTEEFEIQRSVDGLRDWESIGYVDAIGWSSENIYYSFIDKTPLLKSYYRLKIVDFDGYTDYSEIEAVKREIKELEVTSIFPNPTESFIDISFNTPHEEQTDITLIDILGNKVFQINPTTEKGRNSFRINLETLPIGTYFLNIRQEQHNFIERIIKQ